MAYTDIDQVNKTYKDLEETQKFDFPLTKEIDGYTIQINKNVFDPVIFQAAHMFGKMIPVFDACEFLEIGCGTGLVSLIAAKRGASRVIAVDITQDALQNTMINMEKYGFKEITETRISDVFSAIKDNEKFDVIFWNIPFWNRPKSELQELTDLQKSVTDCEYDGAKRYMKEGHKYLKPGGKLTIGFSSSVGSLEELEKCVASCGKKLVEIKVEKHVEIGIHLYADIEVFSVEQL